MIKSIAKKLKNIIWYSSYYDFDGNCIVRNRRIDLIDWYKVIEIITDIYYFIVCVIIAIVFYYITPYIMAFSIYYWH